MMKRVKADLTIAPLGRDCRIGLDGMDISRSVRGFTLSSEANEVTVLTLEMFLLERQEEVSGEFFVQVGADTEAALKHLGWTPPDSAPDFPGARIHPPSPSGG